MNHEYTFRPQSENPGGGGGQVMIDLACTFPKNGK